MNELVDITCRGLRVRLEPDDELAWVDLSTFSQPLRIEVSIDTPDAFDRRVSVAWNGIQHQNTRQRLSWVAKSTLWDKLYHLDVYTDHIEFHAEIHGDGTIDCIRFFDTILDQGFRNYSTLAKRSSRARAYSIGSPVKFDHLFTPEPNFYGKSFFKSYEYAQVSIHGDDDYCGGNYVAAPGILCFAVAAEPRREWLALGLAVKPGAHLFSDYEYLGGSDFALAVTCWGMRRVSGTFHTPRVVMVPAATPEDAIAAYVDVLRASGLVSRPVRHQSDWWSRPIVSGWGHQCYQADLHRIRSPSERPRDNAAYMLSTQVNYRDILERLDANGLPWGTLVIDARWFLAGGLKNVDIGRWPDLRSFIGEQHRMGKKVVLWWGPWDTDGLPDEECVQYQPAERRTSRNSPGRLVKTAWGNTPLNDLPPGVKLAPDVTLDSVRDRIEIQLQVLLGANGFDADGLKIDHITAVPGSYGMSFPAGSEKLFGIEAARNYLTFVYQAAKNIKPDAIVIGHSPNPYFSDVQDMVRISVNSAFPESILPEVTHSVKMARIADPNWLIDMNGWPVPSLAAFREYIELQPTLGIPSLCHTTHIDTTGEALTPNDYARIRKAWSRL